MWWLFYLFFTDVDPVKRYLFTYMKNALERDLVFFEDIRNYANEKLQKHTKYADITIDFIENFQNFNLERTTLEDLIKIFQGLFVILYQLDYRYLEYISVEKITGTNIEHENLKDFYTGL